MFIPYGSPGFEVKKESKPIPERETMADWSKELIKRYEDEKDELHSEIFELRKLCDNRRDLGVKLYEALKHAEGCLNAQATDYDAVNFKQIREALNEFEKKGVSA